MHGREVQLLHREPAILLRKLSKHVLYSVAVYLVACLQTERQARKRLEACLQSQGSTHAQADEARPSAEITASKHREAIMQQRTHAAQLAAVLAEQQEQEHWSAAHVSADAHSSMLTDWSAQVLRFEVAATDAVASLMHAAEHKLSSSLQEVLTLQQELRELSSAHENVNGAKATADARLASRETALRARTQELADVKKELEAAMQNIASYREELRSVREERQSLRHSNADLEKRLEAALAETVVSITAFANFWLPVLACACLSVDACVAL